MSTTSQLSIALQPNDVAAVPDLIAAINTGAQAFNQDSGNAVLRHELITKARNLVQALETPRETMIKHVWAQTGAIAGLTSGVDSGLWKLMAKNGDVAQKVPDLAKALGVDEELLSRLMRHLGAMGYIIETDVDEYKPTNYSKAMALDLIGYSYMAMLTCSSSAPIQFHEWARENNWVTPTDANNTSFHRAYGTKMNFFEWQHHRGYGVHFNHHMGAYRQGRPPWCGPGFYPVAERLLPDVTAQDALLVDVGGSTGHDIDEFRRHFPDAAGRLVLQDLQAVIDAVPADLDAKVERQVHDFLTEQPVKGARAYYMHSILHDWPDNVALTILTRLKEAMKPGFSKILINENVIPLRNAYWETSALDMVMLTCFSSKERTDRDWYHLIEELAGLKIVKIWSGGKGVESLIEVELPQ